MAFSSEICCIILEFSVLLLTEPCRCCSADAVASVLSGAPTLEEEANRWLCYVHWYENLLRLSVVAIFGMELESFLSAYSCGVVSF